MHLVRFNYQMCNSTKWFWGFSNKLCILWGLIIKMCNKTKWFWGFSNKLCILWGLLNKMCNSTKWFWGFSNKLCILWGLLNKMCNSTLSVFEGFLSNCASCDGNLILLLFLRVLRCMSFLTSFFIYVSNVCFSEQLVRYIY